MTKFNYSTRACVARVKEEMKVQQEYFELGLMTPLEYVNIKIKLRRDIKQFLTK